MVQPELDYEVVEGNSEQVIEEKEVNSIMPVYIDGFKSAAELKMPKINVPPSEELQKEGKRQYHKKMRGDAVTDLLGKFNSEETKDDLLKAITQGLKKGNSKTVELLMKVMGLLQKQEVERVGLSPADRIRIAEDLRADLGRIYHDTGNCPVCKRPRVLGKEVCVPPRPEHIEENQVAELGVPDRPSEVVSERT